MGDVSSSARAAGARTVGIIPRSMIELAPDHEADELLVTSTLRERKREMIERADAIIVLPGGLGTLDEFVEVWTERYIELHRKPIAVLDPQGTYDGFFAWITGAVSGGFVPEATIAHVSRVRTARDALTAIATSGGPRGEH
jgi:uncharacterized protein (TIGR00730 family)